MSKRLPLTIGSSKDDEILRDEILKLIQTRKNLPDLNQIYIYTCSDNKIEEKTGILFIDLWGQNNLKAGQYVFFVVQRISFLIAEGVVSFKGLKKHIKAYTKDENLWKRRESVRILNNEINRKRKHTQRINKIKSVFRINKEANV